MVNRKTALLIRRSHRYLGLFLGIQFLLWTISGLYFSWTNLDSIHGDQFKNMNYEAPLFGGLNRPLPMGSSAGIQSIELRDIGGKPFYWINNQTLINAIDHSPKEGITREEALYIAEKRMNSGLVVSGIERIEQVNKHHEYREKLLPAYVISYEGKENLKAYVSIDDGKFQTVRHRDWRTFDFLWMTHTMDYEGRDNFNTLVLRIFSLMGLITVLSGFTLWFVSSPRVRRVMSKYHQRKG